MTAIILTDFQKAFDTIVDDVFGKIMLLILQSMLLIRSSLISPTDIFCLI